jgi:hypothetical protein
LIKNISPRRPTRGTTNLALQFPNFPLDATSTLRDGAHSITHVDTVDGSSLGLAAAGAVVPVLLVVVLLVVVMLVVVLLVVVLLKW